MPSDPSPIVYEAIGAPFLGCCFGPVRNCEVSQLTTLSLKDAGVPFLFDRVKKLPAAT